MVAIVGKYLSIITLVTTLAVHADVQLHIKDSKGLPLNQVQAGYPFIVEVSVSDGDRSMQHPTVKGIEAMRVEGRESRMQIVNGKGNITYGYRVRAPKEGVYHFGPAEVDLRGIKQQSNSASITVVAAAPANAGKQVAQVPVAFARLSVDKESSVVGQKLHSTLRFYYCDMACDVRNIGEPTFEDCSCTNRKGPAAGMEVIDGHDYHYIEWQWDLYPKKAGDITISAYRFDYTVPAEEKSDDFFTALAFFSAHRRVQKRIYSNAVTLHVDPLPDYDGPVHAIGAFTQLAARIKPPTAQEGEGMVLTLELEGDGDLESLELPPLHVGPEFSWYDSKSYVVDAKTKGGLPKKCFEYIVQGMKPGSWELPPQEFTYFDVHKRVYKTYRTAPIDIVIKPNPRLATAAAVVNNTPAKKKSDAVEQAIDAHDDDIRPLHENGPLHAERDRFIPWWIFMLIILVPGGVWLYSILHKRRLQNATAGKPNKKQAFARARAALKMAEQKEAHAQVYPIFINLFEGCLSLTQDVITQDVIESSLVEAGLAAQELVRWRSFFNRIAEIVFARRDRTYDGDSQALFKQAEQWLIMLEKIL